MTLEFIYLVAFLMVSMYRKLFHSSADLYLSIDSWGISSLQYCVLKSKKLSWHIGGITAWQQIVFNSEQPEKHPSFKEVTDDGMVIDVSHLQSSKQ